MKRLVLFANVLAATLFLGGRVQGATPDPAEVRNARAAELLKRFDKNGDGKLDDDERADAKEAMMKEQLDRQAARAAAVGGVEADRAKLLERFDKNHDGKLDDEERAAAEKFARERAGAAPLANARAELIRRLDRNGDGVVDDTERTEGVQYIATHLAEFPGLKARFDQNHDGVLQADERVALNNGLQQLIRSGGGVAPAESAPALENLPPRLRDEVLKRFDRDGDGKLNDEERAAFVAEFKKRRAQRLDVGSRRDGGDAAPKAEAAPDPAEKAKLDATMESFAPKASANK